MIQLENHWTYIDEIWYGHYAIGGYPKLIIFSFLQSAYNMADEHTSELGVTPMPLNIGSYNLW
jgi:hypothetical protein